MRALLVVVLGLALGMSCFGDSGFHECMHTCGPRGVQAYKPPRHRDENPSSCAPRWVIEPGVCLCGPPPPDAAR